MTLLRHLGLAGMGFVLACAPAFAGSISTVDVDGRKVFVNDDDLPKFKSADGTPTHSAKTLIFWSGTEHRWKPVPHQNPAAIEAARSAAADVKNFVASQPTQKEDPVKGVVDTADKDPNFGKIAKGYAVTTAEVEQAIADAAANHGVDPNLVKAIIKVESNFNPHAVSNKGAMGLMQLMPGTARKLNVSNPFDVHQNVDAGVKHFRQLLEDFKGDVKLSLAAYNAGEKAVTDHGGIPPYQETQNYVKTITRLYNGGMNIQFAPTRAPIKVYRDQQGVLTFNNVD
ncbi:Lytic transglycosylase, catalytic [Candidatus Koribacter versatilis Ellin345]|uniref:Lytic transglycosylase, catalytic n=1 Tax=Koribacter versatilis (strain Ellin345) TaxID=204669 RepID=Q1ISJ3_KORVE|nr:lytic transglycosylase domain-containing protein [Candidatus Koribacter versatilis]ABF40157.1 Lytic transglycosylase, catalytic [Candidatus Koribacter versatilis Ellin345]